MNSLKRGLWLKWVLVFFMIFSLIQPVFAEEDHVTGEIDQSDESETHGGGDLISPAVKVEIVGTPLEEVWSMPIGVGVKTGEYKKFIENKLVKIFITTVDVANPYVKVAPLYGKNGRLINKQTVEGMANEKEAIAALNANFFRMDRLGAPFGVVIDEGKTISSMGYLNKWYSLVVTKEQKAFIEQLAFSGEVVAADGAVYPLRNINKEEYNPTQGTSLRDQINLYTPDWGEKSLGPIEGYDGVVEVVVREDTVWEIRENQPAAAIPADGYVLWGHGAGAKFIKEHIRIGDSLIVNGRTLPEELKIQSAVGGHTLLVNEGKPVEPIYPNLTGLHPRSAVGVSKDGSTLYLVAVEGVKYSRGMTLEELARLMVEIGAWKAVNFDGGGSTTMAVQLLGDEDVTVINRPKNGIQRAVPDAIGIFNIAPKGEMQGIMIKGPSNLLVGSSVSYGIKGYDTNYKPYPVDSRDVRWTVDHEEIGRFAEDQFISLTSGDVIINAQIDGIEAEYPVHIIGAEEIEKINIEPERIDLLPGESMDLSVKVTTKEGITISASEENVSWTLPEELGTIEGMTFTAGPEKAEGIIQVSLDGKTAQVPVHVGVQEEPWLSMDDLSGIYHTAYPATIATNGIFQQVEEPPFIYSSKKSTRLTYNFSNAPSSEVRIAYGRLGKEPILMPGRPLGLGLWVYGDNSKHWLRAEIIDAEGKLRYIDLAKEVNWNGWKYVSGSFPRGLIYPLKLRSLYLVNLPEGTEQRPLKGTVYFDEISLYQPFELKKEIKESNSAEGDVTFQDVINHWAKKEILSLASRGIVKGMDEFRFEPDQPLTRAQFVVLLSRALQWKKEDTNDKNSQNLKFTDPIPVWAMESVQIATAKGIITGYQDQTFRPNQLVTRAEMAAILARTLNVRGEGQLSYKDNGDIPSFAKEPVAKMSQAGLLKGANGYFYPKRGATRGEAAVVIYRVLTS
ncbi:phosphodiester glycosidase family protein [Microaerobacter geothermalis]|uniref:phosphodiester glycosidase family protein n=1 Tax=Microaerobacter geothermalis TaxID=674972 RepID=UPI001F46966B|nr:phosphodiester glycosidase family protein [Microaerobacter geothermalis]MCF6093211.1 phosphodiester glycosidase family protein [Microaerobacter geothermalis]